MNNKMYRYYCTQRPPMPGTIPRGMINIIDFGELKLVDSIHHAAWGYVEYPRRLTAHEVYMYELTEAELYD